MGTILNLDNTLKAETDHINKRREALGKGLISLDKKSADKEPLTALCLSGGGIRSASFSLGVVATLAKHKILKNFDYLSCVSGGGYTGALISRWVHTDGYNKVEEILGGADRFSSKDSPLLHFRRYVSYLTPSGGGFSTDAIAGAISFVRNMVLNWLIYIALLLGVVAFILALKELQSKSLTDTTNAVILLVAIPLFGGTISELWAQRPGWKPKGSSSYSKLLKFYCVPMFVASILLSFVTVPEPEDSSKYIGLLYAAGIGCIIYLCAYLIALFPNHVANLPSDPHSADYTTRSDYFEVNNFFWKYFKYICFLGVGAISGVSVFLLIREIPSDTAIIFMPALIALILIIGDVIYIILTSNSPESNLEREWLARTSAQYLQLPIIWIIFSSLIMCATDLRDDFFDILKISDSDEQLGILGFLTATFGAISVAISRIKKVTDFLDDQPDRVATFLKLILFGTLALFFAGLIVIASLVINNLAELLSNLSIANRRFDWVLIDYPNLVLCLIFVVIGLTVSLLLDVNKFSLHDIYKNRLIRTFLGASNRDRDSNNFTDMDPNDDIKLSDLKYVRVNGTRDIPPQLHIVNMALNVPSSDELAWNERKALPFSASQISAGSRSLEMGESNGKGAYRPIDEYAGGMTLGSAMAISGAAVNSNMGSFSKGGMSFLLTWFNLRLGVWLGNPASSHKNIHKSTGPGSSIKWLALEALGLSSENSKYVQLSDGGHFDNLGLCEMVQRECKIIVVVDAGADPHTSMWDLAKAVRICKLDLGVQIDIPNVNEPSKMIEKLREKEIGHLIGKIKYSDGTEGELIYIKPVVVPTAPVTATSYAADHNTFPHETTADQWFQETQFEAYVSLGAHLCEKIIDQLKPKI